MKGFFWIKLAIKITLALIIIAPFLFWWYTSQTKKINVFPLVSVRVTIPEGYDNREIAERFKAFKNFNAENFLIIAAQKEGYLFPDTYFFTGKETEREVIKKMEDNFETKVAPKIIPGETLDRRDIVIMASILEKEARLFEDKKMVAGILHKRLEAGMPLQVDASLVYLLDKTSAEMTIEDLNLISPYNTYKNKGLPPGPIANPGLESIEATLEPTSSVYWYYLSDRNGIMHYAKSFEEHKINKVKYLRVTK